MKSFQNVLNFTVETVFEVTFVVKIYYLNGKIITLIYRSKVMSSLSFLGLTGLRYVLAVSSAEHIHLRQPDTSSC